MQESKPVKSSLSCSEAGKRGGERCKELYGREYYAGIGRLGGQRSAKKLAAEIQARDVPA